MAYLTPEIKQFRGLYLQPNSFDIPDGGLEEANNASLSSNFVLSKCRGYYTYFTPIGHTIVGLTRFNGYLLAVYNDKVVYYTNTGSSPNEVGSENTITLDTNLTISLTQLVTSRFEESNGNLYFTTDNGVYKLTSVSGIVTYAGAPQGIDLSGFYRLNQNTSWFLPSSQVAYRVLFGYKDDNNNLILGSPSSTFSINNPAVIAATATQTAIAPFTITVTSTNHGLQDGMYMRFYTPLPDTQTAAAGIFVINVISADQFTYEITATAATLTNISYAYAMPISLEFSIPSQITSNFPWFYRIYRSSQQAVGSTILSDYQLIHQGSLTPTDLSRKLITFTDTVPDSLRLEPLYTNQNSGEGEAQANSMPPKAHDLSLFQNYLFYSNITNRAVLPLNVINTTPLIIINSYLELRSSDAAYTVSSLKRRYLFVSGIGNKTVHATTSTVPGDLLITLDDPIGFLGFPVAGAGPAQSVGYITIYIYNIEGTGVTIPEGTYYVIYNNANSFYLANSLSNWIGGTRVQWTSETSLYFEAVIWPELNQIGYAWTRSGGLVTVTGANIGTNAGTQFNILASNSTGAIPIVENNYEITVVDANTFTFVDGLGDSNGTFIYNILDYAVYVNSASSTAVKLRDTAQSIVKAVNRDPKSLIYAQYSSLPNETSGGMLFYAKSFTGSVYARSSASSIGKAFYQALPDNFTNLSQQVFGEEENLANASSFSKINEHEAVPFLNQLTAGSESSAIYRSHALRNALIYLKKDGIWRATGDSQSNFSTSLVDPTSAIVAENSSAVIDNQVYFLSSQGIVACTETAANIVSLDINDPIKNIIQQDNINSVTCGVSYEIERNYYLTSSTPNDQSASDLYVLNTLSNGWTTQDWLFSRASLGPDNVMYLYTIDGRIIRERKDNTKIDFCAEFYSVDIIGISSDNYVVIEIVSGYIPKVGDGIVKDNAINNISSVTLFTAGKYIVSFFAPSNIDTVETLVLYEGYQTNIKLSPYSGGLVGRSKQFAAMQIHFRDPSTTSLKITFSGDYYYNSSEITWITQFPNFGWGSIFWGLGTWGYLPNINLPLGTAPSTVCRTYVPREQQRGSFIQPRISNRIAGDKLNIQALSFAVRTYGEKTAR
jgi:hypothetical protein